MVLINYFALHLSLGLHPNMFTGLCKLHLDDISTGIKNSSVMREAIYFISSPF